jgi:ribonuclease HII
MINEYNDFDYGYICSTDEAGAGCLAGAVVAAAVVLPKDFYHPLLKDSKKMSEKNRDIVFKYIVDNALEYSITEVDNNKIDEINILQARFLAMDLGIKKLKNVDYLLVDGNRFYDNYPINYSTVIKGDSKYQGIAAASVLAKVYRDELMSKLHLEFPMYNWCKNKGYGVKDHYTAIEKYGITKYHRRTFLKNIYLK